MTVFFLFSLQTNNLNLHKLKQFKSKLCSEALNIAFVPWSSMLGQVMKSFLKKFMINVLKKKYMQ